MALLEMLQFLCCDNSSSSHTDSYNNNFPVLGEGSIDDSSNCVAALKRKFSINCTKPKTKFCLNLHYNGSYLFAKGK